MGSANRSTAPTRLSAKIEAIVLEPELRPPFDIVEPRALASALVCNSPHSGQAYTPSFLASARLDAFTLRRSEDTYVDELFTGAVAAGAPLMRARFPRAYLDVNREPYELDPRMFEGRLPAFANTRSMRVAAGLGTIPRLVGEQQEIYARKLSVDEAVARIETLYKPYHRNLRSLVQRAERAFGASVLIDCHSMPSASHGSSARDERVKADFVVGDRFGTSCAGIVIEVAEAELRRLGYAVLRNKPYAGGFITEHYGNPAANRHALQIEVNRALYMDEVTLRKSSGFARVARDLVEVLKALSQLSAVDLGQRRAAAE
ncbi:MAG: N-formylglutamate amidohydrolase [Methylobacteriaceae bacterium]|nr:N-formylglutamate amidohydrolase [Methylobacteriaceae bacterium]